LVDAHAVAGKAGADDPTIPCPCCGGLARRARWRSSAAEYTCDACRARTLYSRERRPCAGPVA
jgi:hypothetical protein